MEQTHTRHFDGAEPGSKGHLGPGEARPDETDEYHLDSVNIDTELTNLSGNNFKYRATAEMMLRKMTLLKHTISEGGK